MGNEAVCHFRIDEPLRAYSSGGACRIAGARLLDLDDLGAVQRQLVGGKGRADDARDREHLDTRQGSRVVVAFRVCCCRLIHTISTCVAATPTAALKIQSKES